MRWAARAACGRTCREARRSATKHQGTVRERNSFGTAGTLSVGDERYGVHRLGELVPAGLSTSLRIVLENLLRHQDGVRVTGEQVEALLRWGTVQEVIDATIDAEMYSRAYADVFTGDERWRGLEGVAGETFAWDEASTYLRRPPYLDGMTAEPAPVGDLAGARVLVKLGDSVTTDHISPAGAIPPRTPAGQYLAGLGVCRFELNTYASRRGNHEVMIRGCFANVRLRNQLVPEEVGGWTRNFLTGDVESIYDAARAYRAADVPLVVLAGKGYGTGSSRDWAAKGPALLGVRLVLAESFERIHRSNLVGMGVLPLQFAVGESVESLGLTGEEVFEVRGLRDAVDGGGPATVTVLADGRPFSATVRLDTAREAEYFRHSGIMRHVLRGLLD